MQGQIRSESQIDMGSTGIATCLVGVSIDRPCSTSMAFPFQCQTGWMAYWIADRSGLRLGV